MPRFIVAATFFLLMLSVSNCEAQRTRLFQRMTQSGSMHSSLPSASSRTANSSVQKYQANHFEIGRYSNYRNPLVSRILDGPVPPSKRDPVENESRYIGGFHQSNFDNIGIPSGDIGIRGNAWNWRTW